MTPGKAYLTSDEIRPLARRSNLMGAWLVAHCWGTIVLAIGLFALWPNPVTFLLAVILIGSRQLGLAILMHEAAHSALFKSRWLNDRVGEWLCGWPIMADLHAYRHYHLTHHRFTQTDKDPDLVLSEKFPTSHASMRRKFLRDLTGQTGIRQLLGQITMFIRLAGDDDAIDAAKSQSAQAFKSNMLGRAFPVFIGIAVAIGLIGDWWWGLAFWLLPYLTWFQFVLRVRNIAEHGAVERSDNPLQNVRTTHAGPVARALVAPYYVNYHLEHHMVMHVPCWQLHKMHALLMDKGLGDSMRTAPSYRAAMMEAGWRSS
ncbi:fatty acid desaturase family protein [Pseudosulfitobacter sp. DSM 107133]|uniref:fatty acid desaturase family protein n=1 Tax=Pseudosulfitobacter sp. DSM 107133 TaxID=2883100 RepID=UPI000DF3D0D9|nr:fatty acid desaturase family protein [Pseudosulfitobacter sp. DSM 107133]UOA28476.1 Delta(12)-fatty-acid desaturase [Pseudosulfitobacter sp. DSM 107133]